MPWVARAYDSETEELVCELEVAEREVESLGRGLTQNSGCAQLSQSEAQRLGVEDHERWQRDPGLPPVDWTLEFETSDRAHPVG